MKNINNNKVVSFDIDGVVRDLYIEFDRYFGEIENLKVLNNKVNGVVEKYGIQTKSLQDYLLLNASYEEMRNIYINAKVINGFKELCNELKDMGYDIYLISSQRYNSFNSDLFIKLTTEFLVLNNIRFDKLIYTAPYESKIDIIEKNNIMIHVDDEIKVCEKIMEKTDCIPIIFNGWTKIYDDGDEIESDCASVNSHAELLELFENASLLDR